ncbi:hypothetical protein SEA_GARDENSTATE_71 [Microbacterium phage GardenState]|uniref:Uncharacterized protein n=1 Tax=Microbacterium phage GardenState TaxID=2776841 RepID=A0A7L8ZEQ7_9CAUD|nr:hypothetical protein SEA_GARDENSTATE_71 [Microbacterium phage GardenState]
MDRQKIRASIAARPDSETLAQAIAGAAYEATLEAQRAGKPSSVKASILMAYAEEGRAMREALEALESAGDAQKH